MTDTEVVTLHTVLEEADATRNIAEAATGRQALARKYVLWVRRQHPEATPAEVIEHLERHYMSTITTAGSVIAVGAIAAEIGVSMIPLPGLVVSGAKKSGARMVKAGAKHASMAVAKSSASATVKTGAQQIAMGLPAGDEQLQFEITAIFGLAIAEIHGMDLDNDQATALVYGLSNERVGQQQIATMAVDIASTSSKGMVDVARNIAEGHDDWSHWAITLSEELPAGAAKSLVRTILSGKLDVIRRRLSGKQQASIEYGVAALAGGVARFAFGREVVIAARAAFPAAPAAFPAHLTVDDQTETAEHGNEVEPNPALAALEEASRATGDWISSSANVVEQGFQTGVSAVGAGLSGAAGTVLRPFQHVDLDGDGFPDDPQALTKVKEIGGAIMGATDAVGDGVAGLFKSKLWGSRHRRETETGSQETVEE